MEIIAIVLWVVSVIGFVIWNLYQKNKKMEDAIMERDQYISYIKELSGELESAVLKIDTTMWVQSDPELITLFDTIKSLSSVLKGVDPRNGK